MGNYSWIYGKILKNLVSILFQSLKKNGVPIRPFSLLNAFSEKSIHFVVRQVKKVRHVYGAAAWDPGLIVAQIVCLQCLYYLNLGLLLSFLVGPRVSKMSLVYFFDFSTVTASTVTGWCVMASIFLNSIAGAGFLVYLVERAKKCLDFSASLYIIHLLVCFFYGGWPSSITWWVVNIAGLAVMALLGEYLCMRRELREIPITRY